ncbi:unnamed protein product [Cylindrotheca closterium]|uniref:subtilisin n=1 Tax=Cylindrotheca closterium TaxID=2856 RepID=A0AAD2GAK4_9STRA|nr:unnamed protein product [Cylindrotheca closterium]
MRIHGFSNSIELSIVATSVLQFALTAKAQDYSCDLQQDNCPTKEDEVCDQNSSCGAFSDCYDCNIETCHQLSFDCEGCLNAEGCYWCPGDAQCYNSDSYGTYPPDYISLAGKQHRMKKMDRVTECPLPEDFFSGQTSEVSMCQKSVNEQFRDPLYDSGHWAYKMINVLPVWEQGYTGKGVRVRVNDDGVDADHVEISDKYDDEGSCTIAGASNRWYDASHGTKVASTIAGSANNGACSMGIAHQATISSCNLFEYIEGSPEVLVEKLDYFDISNNSWQNTVCHPNDLSGRKLAQLFQGQCPFQSTASSNPCEICDFEFSLSVDCENAIYKHCGASYTYQEDSLACNEYSHILIDSCQYQIFRDFQVNEVEKGVQFGREGKGAIYVVAAGNYYNLGVDVNMDRITNTRYTIAVGAVDKNENHASYSNPGAALFVTAPGGDVESRMNLPAAKVGGGCTDSSHGTSFAAPVVTGVIALILEANPTLTWRDVQRIIASTSRMVEDDNDDTRMVNDAGYQHSNLYGFGIIDAEKAVSAALMWKNLPPEGTFIWQSGKLNLPIIDDPNDTLELQATLYRSDVTIESITVELDLEHISRGDLDVTLTSPSGVVSKLHQGGQQEQLSIGTGNGWQLMTLKNLGETATGTWTLSIRDTKAGSLGECSDMHYLISDFAFVGCRALAISACRNGEMNQNYWNRLSFDHPLRLARDPQTGLTFEESCCACGGGRRADNGPNALRSWKLVIAGHGDGSSSVSLMRGGIWLFAISMVVPLIFALG